MAELKRVFWDAGHDNKGIDPGAVKYVTEGNVNVKVVNYAVEHLQDNYQCVVYKDITADSINTITKRANNWDADLFISVHFNAGGGDGYESLVYSSKNLALGQMFEKYVKAIGQNSRGTKYRPDLGVLRLTNCKAILCECAFVDNKKDINDWDENAELKQMGIALAKAAADYLNLPKKVKTVKYKTLGNMNFRKKPNTDCEVICQIPEGTTINVQSVDKNGWGKLTYKSKTGYVRIKSETKTYCKKV